MASWVDHMIEPFGLQMGIGLAASTDALLIFSGEMSFEVGIRFVGNWFDASHVTHGSEYAGCFKH